jgi:CubicO group peptidase (beta-lactamase class C family)
MQRVDRRSVLVGCLAASALGVAAGTATPSEIDIAEILRRRVDIEKRTVGMAAVVVTRHGHRIVCYGRERLGNDRKVSGETLFEIGSITKIYTALLLADLARAGVLAIDDPVARHLPADFIVPERDGRPITLADLATHTSGLPTFPPVTRPFTEYRSPTEFYTALFGAIKSYGVADLKGWLREFKLPRTPGSGWEYSNMGYAILAQALSHRTDLSYEELLQRKVFTPLGLTSTFQTPPARVATRVAEGHDPKLNPAPPVDLGIFAPAGSLRSTAEDLGRFLRAVMPGSGSPLEPSAQLLLQTHRPAPQAGGQQALGWEILPAREGDYISKDGVTEGQCATAVFDPIARTGVMVLSNTLPQFGPTDTSPSGGGIGAADVARHILRPSIALESQGQPPINTVVS